MLRVSFCSFDECDVWLVYTFSIDESLFYNETFFCLNRLMPLHEIERCYASHVLIRLTLDPLWPPRPHGFPLNRHLPLYKHKKKYFFRELGWNNKTNTLRFSTRFPHNYIHLGFLLNDWESPPLRFSSETFRSNFSFSFSLKGRKAEIHILLF